MSNDAWVDDLVRRYDDLLVSRYQERLAEDWLRVARDTQLRHRDRLPLARALRPQFVSRPDHDAMMAAAGAVGRALYALCEMTHDDVELRRSIGISEVFDRTLGLEPRDRRRPPLMRLDGFSSTPGAIDFLEANAMPASFLESEISGQFFTESPILAELAAFRFSYSRLTEHLVGSFRAAAFFEGDGPLTIGCIGPEEDFRIPEHVRPLVQHLHRAGFDYVEGVPADAAMRGGKLYVRDQHVNMLIVHPYIQAHLDNDALAPVREAVVSGAVRLQPGPCGMLVVSNKSSFEVLTDEAQAWRFGREQFAELQRHVPWTRQVRQRKTTVDGREVDLMEYAVAHREQLVLKPSFGSQGHEVTLGWKTSASAWDSALGAAMDGHHILQRRAPLAAPRVFPLIGHSSSVDWVEMLSDVNPYVWHNGVAEGVLVRLSADEILNVATGGTIVPLVVVDQV